MTAIQSDMIASCTAADVTPLEVLCTLLEGFEYRHRTSRQTFSTEVGPEGGVLVELSDLMEMAGDDRTPPSILAAIELHLRVRAKLEPTNRPLGVAWAVALTFLRGADVGVSPPGTPPRSPDEALEGLLGAALGERGHGRHRGFAVAPDSVMERRRSEEPPA